MNGVGVLHGSSIDGLSSSVILGCGSERNFYLALTFPSGFLDHLQNSSSLATHQLDLQHLLLSQYSLLSTSFVSNSPF